MSDTPRTDEFWRTYRVPYTHGSKAFARQLERELAEVRKQRDTLAEALRPFSKMMGGHMFLRYDLVMNAEKALATVKGGEA